MKTIQLFTLTILFISTLFIQESMAQPNTFPSSGNVGIGTLAPNRPLHVSGPAGTSIIARIESRHINGATIDFRDPNSTGSFRTRLGGKGDGLTFIAGGAERMNILGNGNIGIGTTNPQAKLDVAGNVKIIGKGDRATLLTFDTERPWYVRQVGTGPGTALEFLNSSNKNFLINSAGKVGIGTRNPGLKLHVEGGLLVKPEGESKVLLQLQSERPWAFLQMNTGAASSLELRSLIAGNKHFIINTDGGVGISTNTIPGGYKLAVDGKVICEELKVQLSENWPDYVFQADYNLPTLEEVAASIETQGHLPGIPSAAAIEAEGGIEIGEMQRKMMEKIEELTLYILQQQEQISAQGAEIQALKTQLNK